MPITLANLSISFPLNVERKFGQLKKKRIIAKVQFIWGIDAINLHVSVEYITLSLLITLANFC